MDKYEQQIIKWADDFKVTLLRKYRQGKLEHDGECPKQLNIVKEIAEEVKDIIIYNAMGEVNKDED